MFYKAVKNRLLTPSFLILLIVLFALLVRIYFFIGFAGGDPQDDGIYINIAKQIIKSGFCDHNTQKQMVLKDETVNPVYVFPSRLLFNYLNVLSFNIFGVNDYSASLFSIVCSLLHIYIIYRIGTLLFNYRVGLLSGFILAIMPLDVIYATRITPDVPVSFFMTLGIYMFLKGIKGSKGIYMFMAGIVIGMGYLVKSTALISILFMVVWIIIHWIKERSFPNKCLFIILGLLLVVILEGSYYQFLTDYFFLRLHLIPKVYKFKYTSEWILNTNSLDLGFIVIEYLKGSLFNHLKNLLDVYHYRSGLSYFGIFYYPIFISFFYMLFKKVNNSGYIICWFMLISLFLEFGPLQITLGLNPLIKYSLIEKQSRYLTLLIAPSVILLSLMLAHVKLPFKRTASVILVLVLSFSSYKCVSFAHEYFTDHTRDLREATKYIENKSPKKVYVDWLGMEQIYFYSGFKFRNLRNIDMLADSLDKKYAKDSYVIIGGARGSGIVAYFFEKNYLE